MTDFRRIESRLINALPENIYAGLINFKNRLRSRPYSLREADEPGIYEVRDAAQSIYLCRRGRHRRYKKSIQEGIEGLGRQYSLDLAEITPGGLFVDCGANIGEMGLWARKRGMDYAAFEPEEQEARCSDLNNFDGEPRTQRKALWKEPTTLTLYSKPDSADSSVIEIDATHGKKEIEAVRLDQAVTLPDGPGTNVFKLEAEGAEPEVLEGASGCIEKFDYVAVDCGYERGVENKHTFVEVSDFLLDRGFRPVGSDFRRGTFLFRNSGRPGT